MSRIWDLTLAQMGAEGGGGCKDNQAWARRDFPPRPENSLLKNLAICGLVPPRSRLNQPPRQLDREDLFSAKEAMSKLSD